MAKTVLTSTYLAINGTDLSSYVKSVELNVEADDVDATTFGDGGWNTHLAGLKSATLDIDFVTDYAASALDSILWPLFGTTVTWEIRPTSAAAGASNPKWTGSAIVMELNPIGGSVGDLAETSVSWPVTGAPVRAVA